MKQKRQVIVLVVLVVIAVLVWSFEWRKQASSRIAQSFLQDYKPLGEENPQLHWAPMERAQETEYKSNGRNPFISVAAPAPQEPKADPAKPKDPPPIPLPPPPPSTASMPPNLKYFGYGTVGNGAPRLAFFYDGEETYVVTEGGTLLGRYRILKVGNTTLQFQEISSGLPGSAPLEEQAAPPSA